MEIMFFSELMFVAAPGSKTRGDASSDPGAANYRRIKTAEKYYHSEKAV